ncbi:MAG: lipopolysaccharide biosynthesis protein [Gammaproteobacteria bacterium]
MQDIGKTLFIGATWAAGMRWGSKLIGLGSMVVLARLLQPEDFGIVALAALLVGLLDVFLELGVGMVLIRELRVSNDDLNTAWTIRIVQSILLAVTISIAAPWAASFFREPRIVEVVYLSAAALLVSGFENVGMILVRKELRFARDFWYQIIQKLAGAVIGIGLALALRNYWALALAHAATAVIGVALSYVMHPYRPWFSLRALRRFLGFSVHVMLMNAARFLGNRADAFVVGRIADATQMGIYNVAYELSSLPSRELTVSVGRALFPTLAKVRADLVTMRRAFMDVLASVTALCVPMGAGIWAVTDDLVLVILGPRWQSASALMGWLALYGTVTALFNIMNGHVLLVTGHERRQTAVVWARVALLLGMVLFGTRWGVQGVAIGATASGCVALVISAIALNRTIGTSFRDYLRILWRPLTSALLMVLVLKGTTLAYLTTPLPRLAASVVGGTVFYCLVLVSLWWVSGRPAGPEAAVLAMLTGRLRAPNR